MGSRKLILLPQVLSIHTFDGAYRAFPKDASPCLPERFHVLRATLADIA